MDSFDDILTSKLITSFILTLQEMDPVERDKIIQDLRKIWIDTLNLD